MRGGEESAHLRPVSAFARNHGVPARGAHRNASVLCPAGGSQTGCCLARRKTVRRKTSEKKRKTTRGQTPFANVRNSESDVWSCPFLEVVKSLPCFFQLMKLHHMMPPIAKIQNPSRTFSAVVTTRGPNVPADGDVPKRPRKPQEAPVASLTTPASSSPMTPYDSPSPPSNSWPYDSPS